MRKLISKFMLINVGMNWSKDTIHPELVKKIEQFEEEDLYINDLYKLDFIQLSQVLFQKKRDLSIQELDRILQKTKFNDYDKEKILKYIPKSNWEKYFSEILEKDSKDLETKWEILYKLRNKVAHNRFLSKSDYNKIIGLSREIKEVIETAITKLGEIDLDTEDRELIINSYINNNPLANYNSAEKSVAEYYLKKGMSVEIINELGDTRPVDLIVSSDNLEIAIEIKCLSENYLLSNKTRRIHIAVQRLINYINNQNIELGVVIVIITGTVNLGSKTQIINYFNNMNYKIEPNISILPGTLTERNEFIPLESQKI